MSELKFRQVGGSRVRWVLGGAAVALIATLYFSTRGPAEPAVPELAPIPEASGGAGPATGDDGASEEANAIPVAVAPAPVAVAPAPVNSDPNVLGGDVLAEPGETFVPKAGLDAMRDRALYAERKLEVHRGETRRLKEQIGLLEARIETERVAALPPPPTTSQQILSTLAPVLSGGR